MKYLKVFGAHSARQRVVVCVVATFLCPLAPRAVFLQGDYLALLVVVAPSELRCAALNSISNAADTLIN